MNDENRLEVDKDGAAKYWETQSRDKCKVCRRSFVRRKKRHVRLIVPSAFSVDGQRIVEIEKLATDM